MAERNKMLDICNMVGDGNNLWFVMALLGAIGLNLLLTGVVCVCALRGGGGGARRGGGEAEAEAEKFNDVQ